MAVPAGFTQHISGYWMKTSDQSGPYAFDGTTMFGGATGSAPLGATPSVAQTAGAAGTLAPSLAAAAGKTTYCSGFSITGAGATAASVVVAQLQNTLGGSLSYVIAVPAGATLGVTPIIVQFNPPIPANATNQAITLNVPSFGAGNTNAAAVIWGYTL